MIKNDAADSTSALRFICLLGAPRTGSSHLCFLLRSCPGLNMKAELFHPTRRGPIDDEEFEDLRSRSKGAITDDESLCTWRSANPGLTLDTLFKRGQLKPVVFKLFPGHVDKKLIVSEIFGRKDVGYILLRRRPIESFISSRKARVVVSHAAVDTTQTKPDLDPNEFIKWCHFTRGWYDWVAGKVEAGNFPTFKASYERNLQNKDNADALSTILKELESIGFPNFPLGRKIKSLTRQDREDRYQNRVANWAEFEKELRADPETAALLEWAETAT